MNKKGKGGSKALYIIFGVVVVALLAFLVYNQTAQNQVASGTTEVDGKTIVTNPNYQPTASYATFDKFSATSVGGTSYYQKEGNPAQTTAYTNVVPGKKYTYWVSNSTNWYVQPLTFTADTGVNDNVNKNAFNNGSVTFTAYNLLDKCLSDGVNCNMSMGANKQGQMEFTFLGGAKTANLPFGGVFVVEYNNTLSGVTCSGDGIVGLNNKYHLTYQSAAVTNAYIVYEVAPNYDVSTTNGQSGVTRTIKCTFNNGATAVAANQAFYAKFIPANYYIGNDGQIYLDVEQWANSATTRTGFTNGLLTSTFYTEA